MRYLLMCTSLACLSLISAGDREPPKSGSAFIAATILWDAKSLTWWERTWTVPREDQTCPEPGLCFRRAATLQCGSIRGMAECFHSSERCDIFRIDFQKPEATLMSPSGSWKPKILVRDDLRSITFFVGEGQDRLDRALRACAKKVASQTTAPIFSGKIAEDE
jgi:hypothetical protein